MRIIKIRPVFAVPGVLLIVSGIWLIYPPAAYICAGLCLCAFSTLQVKPPKDEVK